jgi:hypothetical protein
LTIEHISFSAWRDWLFCPYKFKLTRIDKIRSFEGNEYSTFGTAVHDTSEQLVLLEQKNKDNQGIKDDDEFDASKFFEKRFKEELSSLPEEKRRSIPTETISEMKKQGNDLVDLILPSLKEYFGEYELFSAEYEIRQQVDGNPNFDFYGFVDLIVKTPDGKHHIIDWKTCSWGWDMQKRTSKEYTYQLTFYKHFLSKQLNLDPKKIETHFGLLKRTAKKDKVEIFRVTSGEKKVSNALNILDKCVKNVEKSNFVKNKLACTKCEFNKTVYCQ